MQRTEVGAALWPAREVWSRAEGASLGEATELRPAVATPAEEELIRDPCCKHAARIVATASEAEVRPPELLCVTLDLRRIRLCHIDHPSAIEVPDLQGERGPGKRREHVAEASVRADELRLGVPVEPLSLVADVAP